MDELAARFESHRTHLRGVAYRMLGSAPEAEDAVQEAWFRLSRTDVSAVDNLAAWLTTVVSRICLDLLRSRAARREDTVGEVPDRIAEAGDPQAEAILVDSVGRALLVVLNTLSPAERVAFVLHDLFAVPFDRIAPIVGRTPVATKKLASRARQRVQGTPAVSEDRLTHQRQVVDAFLAAARAGDLDGLLAVLAPDVVRRADAAALPLGVATVVRGARAVAEETVVLRRNSRFAVPMLVDGAVGIVVAPHGRVLLALIVTVEDGRITKYDVVADPARLRGLDLAAHSGEDSA
ncbi:putative RNA polymerase sigma factor [Alloactinosynnema sp. L-07]|uniref:sigma-70 family RNA polymerase sigma factor n=1 Tax=Alloactinosynnema sp. L-07 TaxID=1653480 RepID=UPI00065EF4B3|nr:sigma-70 family RNA polymerase sigma factor [Alloactinosynnema sp. L-07]CRK57220.1 putative RNA polymerase sigma factor [Alloactinosynnema sp. L-07]